MLPASFILRVSWISASEGLVLPLWNSYSFFVTYANVDNWQPQAGCLCPNNPVNPLDRWILSSLTQMVEEIQLEMDKYNLQRAANRFEKFIEDLTNWYIRRSRRRFWKSQNDTDKQDAYQTLHYVLLTFAKTAAPFIPFTTEMIYQNLKTPEMPESVHLCDYPKVNSAMRDERLDLQMENTMTAVSLGRFLRSQHSIKVRQPLSCSIIVINDLNIRSMLEETSGIIAEELNVKRIEFRSNEEELVNRKAKANFKVLGPKLGPKMKEAAAIIAGLPSKTIGEIITGFPYHIKLSDNSELDIIADDLIVEREEKTGMIVATESGITLALDLNITRELEEEGFAREFVSKIQNLRKDTGLEVSDRINIYYTLQSSFQSALVNYNQYICGETLAISVKTSDVINDGELLDINGIPCYVKIEKKQQ